MSNIVRQAGIAKGSFYQYFQDKKHLYLYLVQSAMDAKIKKLKQKLKENKDLFDFLRSIGQTKFMPDPKQVGFMLKIANDNSVEETQEIIQRTSNTFFLELLKKNKANFNPNIELQVIAFVLTTLFTHYGKFLLTLESLREREAAYENLINILEQGIRR